MLPCPQRNMSKKQYPTIFGTQIIKRENHIKVPNLSTMSNLVNIKKGSPCIELVTDKHIYQINSNNWMIPSCRPCSINTTFDNPEIYFTMYYTIFPLHVQNLTIIIHFKQNVHYKEPWYEQYQSNSANSHVTRNVCILFIEIT